LIIDNKALIGSFHVNYEIETPGRVTKAAWSCTAMPFFWLGLTFPSRLARLICAAYDGSKASTGGQVAKTKTKPTRVSVGEFIAAVENDARREDAKTLLKLFGKATGWEAQMWGPTIVGFGAYHYTYDTGHSGSSCVVGFSPRKANLVVYVFDFLGKADLLEKLGRHKGGLKQCLYINKLAGVDIAVLEKILKAGVAETKKTWPVTAS
jgi:hypothetical protein